MNRDCSSGGFIRLVNITKDSVIREVIRNENVPYQMWIIYIKFNFIIINKITLNL